MPIYTKSKYLNVINRDDGYAIFNSMFGGLLIIDNKLKKVLDTFNHPTSIDDYLSQSTDKKQEQKIIQTFIKRYFIVEESFDEYDAVQLEKNRRLENIESGEFINIMQLITTNKCNFNCEYCFLKTMYSSEERQKLQGADSNQVMTFDVAKKSIDTMIDLAHKNKRKYIIVEFFGGEPLCNWSLIEKVLDTYESGKAYNLHILYHIVTNGFLINEVMAKKFGQYDIFVALSYDSPGTTRGQNKIDLTDMIQSKVDLLNKYSVTMLINSSINKSTVDQYDYIGLIDFMCKNKIKKLTLIHDLNIDTYDDPSVVDDMINKSILLLDYAIDNDIEIFGSWQQIFSQLNRDIPINMVDGCKSCAACGNKLSIEPTGDVFSCKSASAHLGSIDDMQGLLTSTNYVNYVKRSYDTIQECKNCILEGFCSGLCLGAIEKKYKSVFSIEKEACRIFRTLTIHLIQRMNYKNLDHLVWKENLT